MHYIVIRDLVKIKKILRENKKKLNQHTTRVQQSMEALRMSENLTSQLSIIF